MTRAQADPAVPGPGGPVAPIETPRLRLRKLAASDLDRLCELDSDPEVMRFITGGAATPRDVLREVHLPRMLQAHPEGPAYGFWAAEIRGSGEWAGWFHLRPERLAPGEMELGYRLRRAWWGGGLATEGSRALLARGFEVWGLPRVVAATLSVNAASRRVMEKCGMRWERDFVYPAEWLPGWDEAGRRAVRYVIEAADWSGRP